MQGKADFIAKARAFMDAEGMAADAGDNRITNIGARSRLSLIFDTMTRCCYGQARWESGMTPEMLYAYPAWRFVRHPGARMPRPLHVLNEGAVRLKTDFQFWAVEMNSPAIGGFLLPWPLYGFNSWMDIESVSRAECIRSGLIAPDWVPGPVDMSCFGATLPERLMNRSASVQKVKDPALAARLRESLKKRFGLDALDRDGRLAIPAHDLARRIENQDGNGYIPDAPPVQMMLNMDMVSKVGDKINLPKSGISRKVRTAVNRAVSSIDAVHTDGPLPQAHISQTPGMKVLGSFNPWEPNAPYCHFQRRGISGFDHLPRDRPLCRSVGARQGTVPVPAWDDSQRDGKREAFKVWLRAFSGNGRTHECDHGVPHALHHPQYSRQVLPLP